MCYKLCHKNEGSLCFLTYLLSLAGEFETYAQTEFVAEEPINGRY